MITQGGQNGDLKRYLKLLTKLTFKFNMLWLLVLKYGIHSAVGGVSFSINIMPNEVNAAYSSFYQALSQFYSVDCVVQTRLVTKETALPDFLYSICQEACDTATIKHDMLLTTYIHRPFLVPRRDRFEDVQQAHCRL